VCDEEEEGKTKVTTRYSLKGKGGGEQKKKSLTQKNHGQVTIEVRHSRPQADEKKEKQKGEFGERKEREEKQN